MAGMVDRPYGGERKRRTTSAARTAVALRKYAAVYGKD